MLSFSNAHTSQLECMISLKLDLNIQNNKSDNINDKLSEKKDESSKIIFLDFSSVKIKAQFLFYIKIYINFYTQKKYLKRREREREET